MTKISKGLKTNVVTFPKKLNEGEREVEAIVFAAAMPSRRAAQHARALAPRGVPRVHGGASRARIRRTASDGRLEGGASGSGKACGAGVSEVRAILFGFRSRGTSSVKTERHADETHSQTSPIKVSHPRKTAAAKRA